MKTTGYIYLAADPSGRNCILGAGATACEAWAQVAEENGPFWADDLGVGPYMIRDADARITQFAEFPATKRLLALVEENGGGVAWEIVDGVADVFMTADERSLAEDLEATARHWADESDGAPTRLSIRRNDVGSWNAWFEEDGDCISAGALIVSDGTGTGAEGFFAEVQSGRSWHVAELAIEAWGEAEAEAAR